jgi:hypothetical protein
MARPFRITGDDPADPGFALRWLYPGAPTQDQMTDRFYRVIEATDPADLASWIFDRLDLLTSRAPDRRSVQRLTTVAGFSPDDPSPTRLQLAAIDGLGWLRRGQGEACFDLPADRANGLEARRRRPGILARLAAQFPDAALPAWPETA